MSNTFSLTITKIEQTRNGIHLTAKQRDALCLYRDEEVVTHTTILYAKAFRSAKAAWEAATPELIDACGLVWDASARTYSNEYAMYIVDVSK